jgi:hypothetical protein
MKKYLWLSIAIILGISLFSVSCSQADTSTPPITTPPVTSSIPVTTTAPVSLLHVAAGGVSSISISGATVSGSLSGAAALERGFEWGSLSGKYEYSWAESGDFQPGSFSRTISGLDECTTYYFRCKARSGAVWSYGTEQNFKTLAAAKITAIKPDTATQGENLLITITGSGFTGVTAVSCGDNISVNRFTVISETQISANITIAERAAGGTRTLSITTAAGIITMAEAFNVARILRTVVWTDENFDWLSHFLTGNVKYAYHIHLQKTDKMYVTSVQNFSFGIEVRDGKLCYTNVPASAWDNVYYTSYPHLRYDTVNKVMTTDSLPREVLQTLFDPPEDVMPMIESLSTADGTITLTYYSP